MKRLLITTLLVVSAPVFAGQTIFQCTTTNGKQILLVDNGPTLTYSFGKVGKPEIVLTKPRNELSTHQWEGIGRYETYTINIPNGDVVYTLQQGGADHLNPNAAPDNELFVTVKDKDAATIKCSNSHKTIANIEGVNLPKAPE